MVQTDFDHTIYEIEGDVQDLAKIKNSELLDKKVVKRQSRSYFISYSDMSMEDELVVYLQDILFR